ncbi:MAG: 3'-5' exonuclease [Ideonella sp.]|nr:3'-5' exonuclease [Ideonella sp.]MCC7456196.1 3'-5' exonuclease [Nitrospira sp.]
MSWWHRLGIRRVASDPRRWVVVDVEASGLDAARDRLLAIAAVGVHVDAERPQVALADSFEVVLRQPEDGAPHDAANILLHGIGAAAQRAGVEPRRAIDAFSGFVDGAPLVAFHAAFDRTLIERQLAAQQRAPLASRWLDLDPLATVLLPQVRAQGLDEWLDHFGIQCIRRHNACADALATAELLLRLWPRLRQERATTVGAAIALAAQRRWIG